MTKVNFCLYIKGLAVLCLMISGAPAALSAEETIMEEVVVTGSRIARDATDYVGPTTIVSSERFEMTGQTDLVEILNQIPAVTQAGSIGRNAANGGIGQQRVELRNLGTDRTLVLRDGRRAVNQMLSSTSLGVDLNAFPVTMIDRVEVLADGASAIYGSDAVAGVVNVILRKDFEGLEFSIKGGAPQDDGYEQFTASMILGHASDRGNITFSVEYTDREEIDDFDRDWAKTPLLGELDVGGGTVLQLIGSGIPPTGRYTSDPVDLIFEKGNGGNDYRDCAVDAALGFSLTDCRFNYNQDGVNLVNGVQRLNAMVTANYEFEENLNFFGELMVSHREGNLDFPGTPISGSHGRFTDMIPVPFTNPNIPPAALAVIQANEPGGATDFVMSWRAQDAGQRNFDDDGDTIMGVLGLQGGFGDSWTWEVFYNFGISELYNITKNQVNVAKLRVAVDPAACAADSACSDAATASGSTAIDIFGRGDVTPEFANYILFDDDQDSDYTLSHIAGHMTGDVADLPAGPVGIAFGTEYRKETADFNVSGVTTAGDSGGNFSENTEGDYDVWEAYAEAQIPLLAGQTFAEDLRVEVAGRYSDYDTIGSEFTYKLGLFYYPIPDIGIRGVRSTAFRAPNLGDLFAGFSDNFLSVADPCSGWDAPGADPIAAVNCQADGVPAGFLENALQKRVSQGGNSELDAETADTYTVGVIFQPRWIEGLNITVDYYNIEVDDAIGTPGPADVLSNCYETPGLANPECDRIDRNAQGNIVRFELLQENLNTLKTKGVDITAKYAREVPYGFMSVEFLTTYLDEWTRKSESGKESNAGVVFGDVAEFAGFPEWKTNLRAEFSRNDWTFAITHQWIKGMDVGDIFGFDNVNTEVDGVHYIHMTGVYNWRSWRFIAGIDNLTDKAPPYVPAVSENTSLLYDQVGRYFYAGATVSL